MPVPWSGTTNPSAADPQERAAAAAERRNREEIEKKAASLRKLKYVRQRKRTAVDGPNNGRDHIADGPAMKRTKREEGGSTESKIRGSAAKQAQGVESTDYSTSEGLIKDREDLGEKVRLWNLKEMSTNDLQDELLHSKFSASSRRGLSGSQRTDWKSHRL